MLVLVAHSHAPSLTTQPPYTYRTTQQLLAAVAKERATSPIVPPLLPTIHTLASGTSPAAGSALQPIVLTHTPAAASGVLTAEGSAGAQRSSGPVRASKALLLALWGTAVAPVKLVDALVFPDVDIVR
jgi:hypothetical protein